MAFYCHFFFHGSLADFLPAKCKGVWRSYTAPTPTSVKDAVEAIGIPHVEVMKVENNGNKTSLSGILQPNDRIEVFPYSTLEPGTFPCRFVLDVHLGKLTRLLRMIGVDCRYQNNLTDKEIVSIAVDEQRVVLTRDVRLLKHKVLQHGYWLRSQQPDAQLAEVLGRFMLWQLIKPFSRCIACNGHIETVNKESVRGELLPLTKEYFQEFYRCTSCRKVYWKGSHYEKMLQQVERIRSLTG